MSCNKLLVNSGRAITGVIVVTLIGCAQFEHSFGELRGPETARTVNSSSNEALTKSNDPSTNSNDLSDDGSGIGIANRSSPDSTWSYVLEGLEPEVGDNQVSE
jgi:hypothetical protein